MLPLKLQSSETNHNDSLFQTHSNQSFQRALQTFCPIIFYRNVINQVHFVYRECCLKSKVYRNTVDLLYIGKSNFKEKRKETHLLTPNSKMVSLKNKSSLLLPKNKTRSFTQLKTKNTTQFLPSSRKNERRLSVIKGSLSV